MTAAERSNRDCPAAALYEGMGMEGEALESVREGLEIEPNDKELQDIRVKFTGNTKWGILQKGRAMLCERGLWVRYELTLLILAVLVCGTHSQAAEVNESRVFYQLNIPRSDDSVTGALTFNKPKRWPTAVMITERPGDRLIFVDMVWNEQHKAWAIVDPRQVVGTGVGSEIRFAGIIDSPTSAFSVPFAGSIELPTPTFSVPNGSRLCFRKDVGGWVYVCGLGEITSPDKTTTFGHSRTVPSCLALLKTTDSILQEGAARDLGRLTQAADCGRVIPELAALLKNTNPVLRQAGAEGLGLIGTRDSQAVLLDAVRVEQDEVTKERLKEALCMIGAYVLIDDPAAAGLQEEEAARHYLAMAVEDTRWLPWLHEVVACRALSRSPAAKAALKSRSTSANAVAADAAKRLMSELDTHVEVLGLSW